MSWDEDNRKHDKLSAACKALEERAGITKEMERAAEGRFIPLGALGDPATPDEYFADEYDYFRRKMRDAYFSVQDLELRKQLIAARRELDEQESVARKNRLRETLLEVAKAKKKLNSQRHWLVSTAVSVVVVAVGYKYFNLVGAIGGAVAGFFLGQAAVSSSKAEAVAELEQAKSEHDGLAKDFAEHERWPNGFTRMEERTGEREPEHDHQSAHALVLQSQSTGA